MAFRKSPDLVLITKLGRGEQPGPRVVDEVGTRPLSPRRAAGFGTHVLVPAAEIGHHVEQIAGEVYVGPSPPPDRGDGGQHPFDLGGGIHHPSGICQRLLRAFHQDEMRQAPREERERYAERASQIRQMMDHMEVVRMVGGWVR